MMIFKVSRARLVSLASIISFTASSDSEAAEEPLDRAVVEVAGDAVALGFDGRVGPLDEGGPILVPVLQEMEEGPDGLARPSCWR